MDEKKISGGNVKLDERSAHLSKFKRNTAIWRAINGVMVVFFVLAAIVNINDPDPYLWIPLYGIPALLTACIVYNPALTEVNLWRYVCVLHMVVCLIAIVYSIFVILWIQPNELSSGVAMLELEEARECIGAMIVLAWLAICHFSSFSFCSEVTSSTTTVCLIAVLIFSLLPVFLWSLCYVKFGRDLHHCKDMRYRPDHSPHTET